MRTFFIIILLILAGCSTVEQKSQTLSKINTEIIPAGKTIPIKELTSILTPPLNKSYMVQKAVASINLCNTRAELGWIVAKNSGEISMNTFLSAAGKILYNDKHKRYEYNDIRYFHNIISTGYEINWQMNPVGYGMALYEECIAEFDIVETSVKPTQ